MNLIPKSKGAKDINGKRRAKIRKTVRHPLTFITAASLLASCSMIDEDLLPCAPMPNSFVTVSYKYDYNMYREDSVDSHVGSVYLYVFDKDSLFLFRDSIYRAIEYPDGNVNNFAKDYDSTTFAPGHKYLLVAMAQGNHEGYDASLSSPGFVLEKRLEPGDHISEFKVKLDRNDDGEADFGEFNYKDAYGNPQVMLDTLWSTKPGEIQTLDIPYIEYTPRVEAYEDFHQDITIPLMRITNYIKVNLVHENFTSNSNPDLYNFYIDFPEGNGVIDFTGGTHPFEPLRYHTLRKTMQVYQQKSQGSEYIPSFDTRADDNTYSVTAEFGVSRLLDADGSSLKIVNSKTGEIIAQIGGPDDDGFSTWLANYFRSSYNNQEFLDREYNWTIDIKLKDSGVVDDPGNRDPNNPGGDDPNNPGGDDPNNPGGDDPNNPGGDDPNNPGGDDPNNPGGDDPNNPGGDDPNNPGGDDPNNPGGDDPNNPGGDDPNNPGGDDPNNPGGDDPNNPGGDDPNNPGCGDPDCNCPDCDCKPGDCDCGQGGCDCKPGGGCDCKPGGDCDCKPGGDCDCKPGGDCDCKPGGGCDCKPGGDCDCKPGGDCDCKPGGGCDCNPGGGCDCKPGGGCDCKPGGDCDCKPGDCDCNKPGGDDPNNPGGDGPGIDDPNNPGFDNVDWIQIGCNILGWGRRIFFYDL